MKYKNYSIERKDDRCWTVSKVIENIAPRDLTAPATGELVHYKGDSYTSDVFVGFYSDVGKALSGVVKDLAGAGCADLKDLAHQLRELKSDLSELL